MKATLPSDESERLEALRLPQGKRPHGFVWLISALWLSVILAAMSWMTDYSFKSGAAEVTPVSWPEGSQIHRDPARPTLILFMHPRCPCSRATIGELALLAARCRGHVAAQVWFTKPGGVAEDWIQTDLWRTASEIPGVSVYADEAGVEAHRFRALTSGHSMLYDKEGRLLFQGGITMSRGHSGDNQGRTALEELLEQSSAKTDHTPVFGCSLFAPQTKEGDVSCKP